MRNLRFFMAYKGSAYNGFQRQPFQRTIQSEVENALSMILFCDVIINGCSRTDSGVHARRFCFNMKTNNSIPCDKLKQALNERLAGDIRIISCEDVDEKFHARIDAAGKQYLYLINNSAVCNVFAHELVLNYRLHIDEKLLDDVAQIFVGEHDFSAFCKAGAKLYLKSTVRIITDMRVRRNGDFVEILVTGNGFLHNMVRILTGTLLYVNEGKISRSDIERALKTGDRTLMGKTVPPFGLYLNEVFYN